MHRSARGIALLATLVVLALIAGLVLASRGNTGAPVSPIGLPATPREAGIAFGTYQEQHEATLAAAYAACDSQVDQRYPFPASGSLPPSSWRRSWTRRVDQYVAGCHQGFDQLWTLHDPTRAAMLANAYPATACDSSRPTALLLPAFALPDMKLSFAPTADEGAPLNVMGIVLTGVHPKPLSSAATISEHLRDFFAPWMAIQNSNPFNVRHPKTITTSDETITGFTSRTAEARFYSRARPQNPPPEDNVNGHVLYDHVANFVNVMWLPKPNEVVTYSQPGSDVPTTIYATVESGRTILGLDFEGGSGLNGRDVMPYVLGAVHQVVDRCGSLDIMASHSK